MLNVVTTHFC